MKQQKMSFRSILTFLSILFSVTFSLPICDTHAQPGMTSSSALDTTRSDVEKEEGKNKSPSGVDVRWKEGLYLGYHYRDIFKLELGGLLSVDGGYIDVNQVLEMPIPRYRGGTVSCEPQNLIWLQPSIRLLKPR